MAEALTREHVENFRRARWARDPQADRAVPRRPRGLAAHRAGRAAAVLRAAARQGRGARLHHPAAPYGAEQRSRSNGRALLIDRDRAASLSRLTGVQRSDRPHHQLQSGAVPALPRRQDRRVSRHHRQLQRRGADDRASDRGRQRAAQLRRRPDRGLAPAHAVAREHRAHFFDELVHRHLLCASACFFRYASRSDCSSLARSAPAIRSRTSTLPFAFSSAALNDRAGRAAPVRVAKLLAEIVIGAAEIKLGADIRRFSTPQRASDSRRSSRRGTSSPAQGRARAWCRACRSSSARLAAATRRWRSRSPAPADRGSATPARRNARRRRPSRSEPGGLSRPWFRAGVLLRRPGRCSTRGRGRRRDQCGCDRCHSLPPVRDSAICAKFFNALLRPRFRCNASIELRVSTHCDRQSLPATCQPRFQ